MWERNLDGRTLNFHLAGINNQNFIMRDEETGSWWQQITGEAVLGPLKGRRLAQVVHDEVAFSIWKHEQPSGRVLRPDERFKDSYVPANWEEQIAKMRVVTPVNPSDPLAPRDLVIGITAGGASKAYPIAKLERDSPVLDTLAEIPLLLVVHEKSVRAFERVVGGETLTFYAKPGSSPFRLVDSQSGSEWDFAGKCVSGRFTGQQLTRIVALSDYWFDWKTYNPYTEIY